MPACPDWTARDLFSHMVGLGSDVVAGDEPDDHNPDWTAKQVEKRKDRPSTTSSTSGARPPSRCARGWPSTAPARSAT